MSDSKNKKPESDKKPSSTGNTEAKDSRRRELLKAGGIVASAYAVPEKWKKPVVDTVLLPAHAQTSGATPAPTDPAQTPAPTPFASPTPSQTE